MKKQSDTPANLGATTMRTPEQALAYTVTPTLPARAPGAGHTPQLRRQSLDYDTNAASDETAIHCTEPTLA